jgi:Leucine-rich repeat (LRR) protein
MDEKNLSYGVGYDKIKKINRTYLYLPVAETVLKPLPNDLVCLDCENFNLTTLNDLPPSLETLYCGNNKLKRLPSRLPNLKQLYCSENNIHWFNSDSLENEAREKLSEIDSSNIILPETLDSFICNHGLRHRNKFVVKVNSNSQVVELLPKLPNLPNSLRHLQCVGNDLTELANLPNKLEYLDCSDNPITKIVGEIPKNICYFRIDNVELIDNETIEKLSSYVNRAHNENSLLNEEFWSITTVYDNGTAINDNVEEIIMRNNTKLKEDVMKEMQNRGFVGGRRKHKNKKTRKNRKK